MNQLALLLQLYVRPVAALGAILDRGRWFAALAFCAVVAILLSFPLGYYESRLRIEQYVEAVEGQAPRPAHSRPALEGTERMLAMAAPFVAGFKIPIVLVVVFAPIALALARAFGGGGMVFVQIAPLSSCLGFAYAAAYLPAAVAAFLPTPVFAIVLGLSSLFFLFLAATATGMVTGAGAGRGAAAAICAAVASTAGVWLFGRTGFASGFLFSPWILYFLYMRFGGSVSGLGDVFRQQQSFRRYLEASTINPHDADAQYQLGVIYQRRGQTTEAAERFKKAIAIDPTEVDAQYQLARLYKAREHWSEALPHLEASIRLNSKHAQFEPARDWAITKLHLGDPVNARITLESYIEQRPYDPEALYYLGKLLSEAGERDRAKEVLDRAVEAVRTTPRYRRHEVRTWGSASAKLLRSL